MNAIKIGWIGAGKMGAPMAKNLIKAGYDLLVFDVDRTRAGDLHDVRGQFTSSLEEAVQSADLVFSSLPSDEALLAVGDHVVTILRQGGIFVDMSTVSPHTSTLLVERFAGSGREYLCAPVSGSVDLAAAGALAIFVSGGKSAFESALPILKTLGNRINYCGEQQEALVLKLLINMIVGATPVIIGEALSFGVKSGLAWDQILDAIADSVIASPVIAYKLDMMKRREWAPMATIDMAIKDFELMHSWGVAKGVMTPITNLVLNVNRAFRDNGKGGNDFFEAVTWPDIMRNDEMLRNFDG